MDIHNRHTHPHPTLEGLAEANQAFVHLLWTEGSAGPALENADDQYVSPLFQNLVQQNQLVISTGFTEPELMDVYRLMQPHVVTIRQPGVHPRSS